MFSSKKQFVKKLGSFVEKTLKKNHLVSYEKIIKILQKLIRKYFHENVYAVYFIYYYLDSFVFKFIVINHEL